LDWTEQSGSRIKRAIQITKLDQRPYGIFLLLIWENKGVRLEDGD